MKKTYLVRECLSLKLSDVKDPALWRVRRKEIKTKETVRTKVLRQDRCHGPEIELNRGCLKWRRGFCGGSDGKESASNARDTGSIPGWGGFPGIGNGNLLQYSCLENSVDRGATIRGVAKSLHSWVTEHTHRKGQWSPGHEEEKTRSRKGKGRIFSTIFFSCQLKSNMRKN